MGKNIKNGILTIELQSRKLEKIINILNKNDIQISNIKKLSINVIEFDIDLNNYEKLDSLLTDTNSQIKIIKQTGITFFVQRLKKRISMLIGILIFAGIIAYLSNFIWGIDISTEKNISPYEIRQELNKLGINAGVNKNIINVYHIEEELSKIDDNIMWARVRIIGSKLKVNIVERQAPPAIVNNDTPCNLIAKRDGIVLRVYTKAGTSVVKSGDVVKKGQILVKGEQGNEGSVYQVHASGDVIARTYYDETREVPIAKIKKSRTGNKIENYYIVPFGKKIYLKNSLNKFDKYDKIIKDNNFIKTETYYEVKEQTTKLDIKKVENETQNAIYKNLISKFDKSVSVVDKKFESSINENMCKVRVTVIAEENIAQNEQ